MDREWIAYGLIGVAVLVGTIWALVAGRRRHRMKLRRRGIKHYGH